MNPSEKTIITHAEEASRYTESAYWWMKGIDRDEALRLGINNHIQTVLNLLQKVEGVAIDIVVKIKKVQ